MYAGIVVLAFLGYLLNRAFPLADTRLLAWYRRGAENA
jgi:ABC-type nitrate/sulfonate/bicarbonate transport system permease component